MKRCPTCNQTFSDEWLTFCTSDGTPLVEMDAYQAPTILMQPGDSPPEVSEPASPIAAYAPPNVPSPWQPPPPPSTFRGPSQTMAVWSLVLGIVSITLGWCCSFGLLTAPTAIALGIYALSQIKQQPDRYSGKPLAIGGIVGGGLYFVALAVIIVLYGIGILLSGFR